MTVGQTIQPYNNTCKCNHVGFFHIRLLCIYLCIRYNNIRNNAKKDKPKNPGVTHGDGITEACTSTISVCGRSHCHLGLVVICLIYAESQEEEL